MGELVRTQHVCAYTYVYIYSHIHTYTYCIYIYMNKHPHTHKQILSHVCVSACVNLRVCICVHENAASDASGDCACNAGSWTRIFPSCYESSSASERRPLGWRTRGREASARPKDVRTKRSLRGR
jgi:hypothetical protein